MAQARLGNLQQAAVQRRPLGSHGAAGMHGGGGVDALGQLLGAPGAVAKAWLSRGLEHLAGVVDQAREHAHPIGQQAAVGRVVNGRLDHGGVDPQLAPARHLEAARQLGHAVQQSMQRLGLHQVGPAQQRRVVRH